jgi:hypothetical protein
MDIHERGQFDASCDVVVQAHGYIKRSGVDLHPLTGPSRGDGAERAIRLVVQ